MRRPALLIVATTRWPLSARLASRMISHGCAVHALCPRGHVLADITGIDSVHSFSGFSSLTRLERAIAAVNPDLIVPADDRAVWQLHGLHERRPALRGLLERSLGDPRSFPLLRSRAGLMERARELGLRAPDTMIIRSREDLQRWFDGREGDSVLKLDGTSGGSGVKVATSPEQAAAAWQKFLRPERRGLPWKRWLVNGDPLLFCWQSAPRRDISIQQYIPGRPANAMLAAWRGRMLGIVTVAVLCTQYPTGPSTIVRLIRDEEITRTADRLVTNLGLSGFYGLDFMLEESSGLPYLIEVNARCTQLGHLTLAGQGDLTELLCGELGARGLRVHAAVDRDVVAFFPQALAWNPDSPFLQNCHHDVPWEEPVLVRQLLRDPAAERRWIGPLYRRLRGINGSPLPNTAGFLIRAAEQGLTPASVEYP